MFEVGKKYRSKYGQEIHKCLWADEKSGLMEGPTGTRWSESQKNFEGAWKEYVEPKVLTEELHLVVHDGELWASPYYGNIPKVGTISISYTEGRGIEVSVIEGGIPDKG